VLDACRELGITLIAYQPLAMGVLTGKYRPGDRPKGIRRFGRYYRGGGLRRAQPVLSLLGEIGERHAKTPAQVALRWLIEQDGVLPIPGAKTGRQAASNAEALSFSLVAAELEALDRATTAWRR
jgi:aryl-alcohol dehydrogenase-like predicted oxidoreductase